MDNEDRRAACSGSGRKSIAWGGGRMTFWVLIMVLVQGCVGVLAEDEKPTGTENKRGTEFKQTTFHSETCTLSLPLSNG